MGLLNDQNALKVKRHHTTRHHTTKNTHKNVTRRKPNASEDNFSDDDKVVPNKKAKPNRQVFLNKNRVQLERKRNLQNMSAVENDISHLSQKIPRHDILRTQFGHRKRKATYTPES